VPNDHYFCSKVAVLSAGIGGCDFHTGVLFPYHWQAMFVLEGKDQRTQLKMVEKDKPEPSGRLVSASGMGPIFTLCKFWNAKFSLLECGVEFDGTRP
jgi:hypothetical protein